MREIKFRAWDEDLKKMFYSQKGHFHVGGRGACSFCSDWLRELLAGGFVDKGGNHKKKDLMQYTGLKDKNGKEIYENDIVKIAKWQTTSHLYTTGKVFMRLGCWFVELEKELGYYPAHEIEIIGNIHQNPELLEKPR